MSSTETKSKPVITSTLSCGLRSIIKADNSKRQKFLNFIDRTVVVVSKLRHEASLLANYLLLLQLEHKDCKTNHEGAAFDIDIHLGDEKRWQQFYRACLKKVEGESSGARESKNYQKTQQEYKKLLSSSLQEDVSMVWEEERKLFNTNPDDFDFHIESDEDRSFYSAMLNHPHEFQSLLILKHSDELIEKRN